MPKIESLKAERESVTLNYTFIFVVFIFTLASFFFGKKIQYPLGLTPPYCLSKLDLMVGKNNTRTTDISNLKREEIGHRVLIDVLTLCSHRPV